MRDSEEHGKPGEEVSKNGTEFHGPMPPTHVAHSVTESQVSYMVPIQLLVLMLPFQHAF